MLARIALIATALCLSFCLLVVALPHIPGLPWRKVVWNADGTNVGYYLQANGSLRVLSIGYGPEIDGATTYDPIPLLLPAALVCTIWFATNRLQTQPSRWRRWFSYTCAAVPALATIAVLERRDDGYAPWFAGAGGLIFAGFGLRHLLKHHLSRADRRLRAGLCPTCGYDLRGTPDRCPECGTDIGFTPQPLMPPGAP